MKNNGRLPSTRRSPLALTAAFALLGACSSERLRLPSEPAGQPSFGTSLAKGTDTKLDVCHLSGSDGQVINVSTSAWKAHREHGDYALNWQVNQQGATGDGINFTGISDALSAADSTRRAHGDQASATCRITVNVAAGDYVGSLHVTGSSLERLPLFIGVPDITLRGASVMQVDPDSRATGVSDAGATTLSPDRGLTTTEALIVVADDESGYQGNGVVIEGFRFTSGLDPLGTVNGGIGIGALRVRDLTIRGNHFDPTMQSALDFRASSAVIESNFAKRLGAPCSFCLSGPGRYDLTGNRLIDGGFVGIFIAPVAVRANWPMGTNSPSTVVLPYDVPAVAGVVAFIVNNEVRDYRREPKGNGMSLRLVSFIKEASSIAQSSQVTLRQNTLYHNNFAMIVDANTPSVSPSQAGDVTLTLEGNAIGPSCRNNVLVSFTRFSRSIGVPPSAESFLSNSTYRLTLNGDASWSNAWYDNSGGAGNTLVVDGLGIPAGKRTSPSDNPGGC